MSKIKRFVQEHTKEVVVFGVFVVAVSIFFVGNAFAALTPTKSVIITSKNTSFEDNEPGSWQVEKSGKWVSKGKARVTFDVDTSLMTEDRDTDIIMVLDISGSMSGDKLDRVKSDSTELIESLLSNRNNQVALITFDTVSTIVSDFTNDKVALINQINELQDTGSTNYYQALVNVDTILQDYQKTNNKEVIVLFLTDGYPNEDTPNQIAQYGYLKSQYPYITVNGIQYEMGDTILNPIKEISDNQFFADMETLNNVLFDASVAPISYDEFQIVDYIDNRYFTLESEDDITVSQGKVKLEEENGKQKITWTISNFNSGRDAKLTMDLNLHEDLIGQGGIYPTNESEEILSSIQGQEEDVTSTLTPVLSDSYQVIYDGNAPDGCTVNNVPDSLNYSVFDTVSITEEQPSCAGYQFKGWEIVNKDITRVGEDYFIMPEENVTIRAEWSKVTIAKSMDGTVNTMGDPIMKRYTSGTSTDYHSSTYKSKITSVVTKDNLDIPTSAIEYWDVSAEGDGSVIAYVEDDGSGNGTYKVTIGGQGGIIANPNSSYLFGGSSSSNGFSSLETIDLTYLDTSRVTNMSYMFSNCRSLTSLDLSNFDTSNVTNMSYMFDDTIRLDIIDVTSFNTSKVTNMSYMFAANNYGSSSQNRMSNLDVSHFDTSNVTNMSNMFWNVKSVSLDVSHFDTSKVINMRDMFYGCTSLTSLDVSNFDTSNVIDMSYMFDGCRGLTSLAVSNFDTSNVIDMSYMFDGCSSLTSLDVSHFDTSKVTSMGSMFDGCRSLTSLDVSNFDTSKVTNMSSMFYSCSNLTSLDVSNFDTSKVTNMSYMFYNCSNLTSLDIGNFDTTNVTSMSDMFWGCNSLTSLDVSNFDTSNVTDMSYMFGCSNLTSLDVSNFDTSKVTNMSYMFGSCGSLTSLNVSNFDTSKVTNMSYMFRNCQSLTSLDVSNFDTSNVTNMSDMFYNCRSLTSLDVSNFDTTNVTSMRRMFYETIRLDTIDVTSFNTSKVTDMSYMFAANNYVGFSQNRMSNLDVSKFDTSNVMDMSNMFWNVKSVSLDVSNFDTSKVTNMSYMFYNCSKLISLDMRNADFSSVTSYNYMFSSVNSTINVIVKDSVAQSFVRARLDEANRTNATVTIASSGTQTSYRFDRVPEFRDSFSFIFFYL